MFCKNMLYKTSQNLHENVSAGASFYNGFCIMEALTLHRKNSTCSSVLLACSFLIHLVLYTLKTENYKVF